MKKLLAVGLPLLFVLSGCSRGGENVLATVGGEKILAEEFRARLSTYLGSTGVRDNIVVRKQIVDNMVNEILILQHVRKAGWEEEVDVRKRYQEIEEQALLDAYAKEVIASNVRIEEADLWQEFRRMNTKVAVRYVYGKTEEEAWTLRRKLERGASFESLARDIFEDPGLAHNGGYIGYVGPGEMDTRFEEAAFSLEPGVLSIPTRIGVGYAILRVDDRKTVPMLSETDFARAKHQVEENVRARKTKVAVESEAARIGESLSPQFNEEVVELFFSAWRESEASGPGGAEDASVSALPGNAVLCRIGGESWTVRDVLERFAFVSERQRRRIRTREDIKTVVTGLASRGVLLDRARQAGLNDDASVQSQTKNVKKSYLLTRWADSVQDAAKRRMDETVLKTHFDKHRDQFMIPPEVNVAEILVRSESLAADLRQRLDRGASFAALARQHTIRPGAAKNGGVLGFGASSKWGALSDRFFAARKKELVGPVFVDPYYAVFKVLGKRGGRPQSFAEAKEEVRRRVEGEFGREALASAISELRTRAEITIDQRVLEGVELDTSLLAKENVQ